MLIAFFFSEGRSVRRRRGIATFPPPTAALLQTQLFLAFIRRKTGLPPHLPQGLLAGYLRVAPLSLLRSKDSANPVQKQAESGSALATPIFT